MADTKPGRTRDLVQAYFDPRDRAMLDSLSEKLAVPRAEVLRIALRRLAAEHLAANQPGASLPALVGALDAAPDVPGDLAGRHDEYLYPAPSPEVRRVAEPKPPKGAR